MSGIVRRPFRIFVEGRSLEAAWWGAPPERAPSIVLLHEGLGCVGMWRDFPTIAGIEAARAAYAETDLRTRLARYHADPDNAFRGWNDAWLDPAFRDWRIDDLLPGIRVPMLIVQGTADEYGTAEQLCVAERAASCPVEAMLIEGANHAPHLSAPECVLDAAASFIARLFSPSEPCITAVRAREPAS